MRKLISTLFCALVAMVSTNAQVITCNTTNFTISNIVCINDVMTFDVSDETTCPSMITPLPLNTTFVMNGWGSAVYVPGNFTAYFYGGLNITVNSPSIGCAPLNVSVSTSSDTAQGCIGCRGQNLLLQAQAAPVPTLGQWALIALCFSILIFGIVTIRSGSISTERSIIS